MDTKATAEPTVEPTDAKTIAREVDAIRGISYLVNDEHGDEEVWVDDRCGEDSMIPVDAAKKHPEWALDVFAGINPGESDDELMPIYEQLAKAYREGGIEAFDETFDDLGLERWNDVMGCGWLYEIHPEIEEDNEERAELMSRGIDPFSF